MSEEDDEVDDDDLDLDDEQETERAEAERDLTEDEPVPPGVTAPAGPELKDSSDELLPEPTPVTIHPMNPEIIARKDSSDESLGRSSSDEPTVSQKLDIMYRLLQRHEEILSKLSAQPAGDGGLGSILGQIIKGVMAGPEENPMDQVFRDMGKNQFMTWSRFQNQAFARLMGLPDHVTVD